MEEIANGAPAGVAPVQHRAMTQLLVTPELVVPAERLPAKGLNGVLQALSAGESEKGLVDAGGVFSFHPDSMVLDRCHPHGFIAAATAAFASHYPLSVRPQHFWLMILQATAVHVEKHAEEVRAQWIAHEGKKELEVRCDEFTLGAKNDWASVVDGKPDCFSVQIDKNTVQGLAQELSPAFSNTSAVENIALKITAMDITKSFFSFKCSTLCGFPSVIMEGVLEDWVLLRRNAELLIKNRCQRAFAEEWCTALLPLLDILVKEYRKGITGEDTPDEQFWNSMCKRGGTSGSGAQSWFNGWINILFPYIMEKPNRHTVPYSGNNGYVKEGRDGGRYGMDAPHDVQGPDCSDFPGGLAAAPVVWDYFGKDMKLKFKAGFIGAEQDTETGVIKPMVGWFIAHDGGEKSPKGRGKGKAMFGY